MDTIRYGTGIDWNGYIPKDKNQQKKKNAIEAYF